jgi:hypothetical protein
MFAGVAGRRWCRIVGVVGRLLFVVGLVSVVTRVHLFAHLFAVVALSLAGLEPGLGRRRRPIDAGSRRRRAEGDEGKK